MSPEIETVELAKAGDPEAFRILYEHHHARVFRLCARMLKNFNDAEDLTQDVFTQVFRRLYTFRGDSAFSTWLHRIAVNCVLMHIRSKAGVTAIPLEMSHNDSEYEIVETAVADRRLVGSLDRLAIERTLEHLPPGYRIVFLLHDVEGYEHSEIAEMLACSVGNCKSQLHKARIKIRKLLMSGVSAKRSHRQRRLRQRKETAAIPLLAPGQVVMLPNRSAAQSMAA